jgi:hypothetical protein
MADKDEDEDEGYATQIPLIAAEIPIQISITTLDIYRRNSLFGKLYSIDMLFHNNSQLNKAFLDAQCAINPSG